MYAHLRTNKSNLQRWRYIIDKSESDEYRGCERGPECGSYVTIGCIDVEARGRRWSPWSKMDDCKRWRKVIKDPDSEQSVVDAV